jgi:hypothetical protein
LQSNRGKRGQSGRRHAHAAPDSSMHAHALPRYLGVRALRRRLAPVPRPEGTPPEAVRAPRVLGPAPAACHVPAASRRTPTRAVRQPLSYSLTSARVRVPLAPLVASRRQGTSPIKGSPAGSSRAPDCFSSVILPPPRHWSAAVELYLLLATRPPKNPSIGPIKAHTTAHCSALPRLSPESESQRPPPPCTAEIPCRPSPRPVRAAESSPWWSGTLFPTFLDLKRWRARQISVNRAAG